MSLREHTAVGARGAVPVNWSLVIGLATAFVLAAALLAFVWLLARPLAILVLAFTIAQALSTVVDWLELRMPRAAAVVLVYLALFAGLGFLAAAIFPMVLTEARSLVGRAPELMDRLVSTASGWTGLPSAQVEQSVRTWMTQTRSGAFQIPAVTVSALFELLLIAFLSLYLLLAGPKLRRFTLSLMPPARRRRASRLMTRMGHAMGGYIRGAGMDGMVIAALTWAALAIVGLPHAPIFAVLAGVGEFVPYVGPIVAAVPAIAVALMESPTQGLIVAAVYVGLQQIDSHLIVPHIMRSQTDIHPALVIFALAAGLSLGGVLGAVVAIPLFAAARVLVVDLAAPALRRHLRARRSATALRRTA